MNLRALHLLPVVWCFALAGCAQLPRDQEGWTARIQENRVLIVGTSRADGPMKEVQAREKAVVEKLAKRLGARVQWREGNAHTLLEELEKRKLPLLAAQLPTDSPFAEKVGLSQPVVKKGPNDKDYGLVVAPGENRLLLLLDQIIAEDEQLKAQNSQAGVGGSS